MPGVPLSMEPAPHRFFFPCHCDTPAWATPCPCGTPDIGNRDRGAPSQEGRRPAAIPSDQAGIRRHCRQCRTQRQQGRVHTPAIDVDNRTPTMGKECSAPRKRGQSPESRTFIPPPIALSPRPRDPALNYGTVRKLAENQVIEVFLIVRIARDASPTNGPRPSRNIGRM